MSERRGPEGLKEFLKEPLLMPLRANCPELPTDGSWPALLDWQNALARQTAGELKLRPEKKLGQRARRKARKIPGLSYEAEMFEEGTIRFREADLHDFFNALIWTHYPHGKRALHHAAYQLQRLRGDQTRERSRLEDRLTLLDEGGVLYCAESEDDAQTAQTILSGAADDKAAQWVQQHRAQFLIFGHGLLEVWYARGAGIHASCLVVPRGDGSSDERLAHRLANAPVESLLTVNLTWLIDGDIPFQ